MSDSDQEPEETKEDVTATMPDAPAAKLRADLAKLGSKPAATSTSGDSEEADSDDETTSDEDTSGDGTSDDGTSDDSDDGTSDDGTSDDGASDDGTSDDGASDDGTSDESTSDEDEDDGTSDEDDDGTSDEPDDPDGTIAFRYFGITDVGQVREHNEDNFAVVDLESGKAVWGGEGDSASPPTEIIAGDIGPKGIVFAVCDGMGGAAAGEVASQMAIDTIREVMLACDAPRHRDGFAHRLVYSIEEAGSRIFGAAKMDRSRRGMGTTATVAGLIDKLLFVGQVGDSRCYVLRNGELALVTKDQSLVNQLIEAGQLTEEEAEAFEHSNIILQALGTTEDVSVDLTFLELRQGDRIMLCSDGLSGLVHAEMIREVMSEGDDLEAIAVRLVEMANAGGGHDNITCVVAELDGDGLAAPSGAPKAVYQQYPLPPIDEVEDDLPRREPTIKTGGRKPGADVKHIQYDPDDPEVPHSRFPWGMLVVALLLLGIVIAVVASSSKRTPPPEPTEVPEGPPVVQPVEVCVRTDVVGGDLFVDGQSYGPLREGDSVCIELLPGAYRFEARVGDSAAATTTLTVREGVPADVELMLPAGALRAGEDAGADGGDASAEESEVESDPADAEEPEDTPSVMTTPPTRMTVMAPTMESAMTSTMTSTMTTMTSEMAPSPMSAMNTMAEETMEASMAPPANPF
ncbi:MAG: PP2C family serine/threonine-protein phosphatase [Myxococcota bacterium]